MQSKCKPSTSRIILTSPGFYAPIRLIEIISLWLRHIHMTSPNALHLRYSPQRPSGGSPRDIFAHFSPLWSILTHLIGSVDIVNVLQCELLTTKCSDKKISSGVSQASNVGGRPWNARVEMGRTGAEKGANLIRDQPTASLQNTPRCFVDFQQIFFPFLSIDSDT